MTIQLQLRVKILVMPFLNYITLYYKMELVVYISKCCYAEPEINDVVYSETCLVCSQYLDYTGHHHHHLCHHHLHQHQSLRKCQGLRDESVFLPT